MELLMNVTFSPVVITRIFLLNMRQKVDVVPKVMLHSLMMLETEPLLRELRLVDIANEALELFVMVLKE